MAVRDKRRQPVVFQLGIIVSIEVVDADDFVPAARSRAATRLQ